MCKGRRKCAQGFVLLSSLSIPKGSGPCKAMQTPYTTCAQTDQLVAEQLKYEGTPTAQLCTGSICAWFRAVPSARCPHPHPLLSPLPHPGSLQGLLFQPRQSVYLGGLKGRSWRSTNRLQVQRRSLFAALPVGLSLVWLFRSQSEDAHL